MDGAFLAMASQAAARIETLSLGSYSTFTFDLRSGQRLGQAPMRIDEVSQSINEPAGGTFEMPVVGLPDEWSTWITPKRTGICVMRDRRAIWSGIIWAQGPTSSHEGASIVAQTFESYLARRWLSAGYIFGQVDQATIVKELLDDIFAIFGGDIRIQVPTFTPTGRLRDREYPYEEFTDLLTIVQQLSGVEDGFDFTIDTSIGAGDETAHIMRLGYPKLGIGGPGDVGSLVWQYPGNVIAPPVWPFEGRDSANETAAIGAGEGTAMLRSIATLQSEINAGYPILQKAYSYKDVTYQSTLNGHAARDLARNAGLVTVPEFSALAGAEPAVIGSWGVGDWSRLRADTPYLRGMYGGVGADVYGRVTGWTLRPGLAAGGEGPEIVTPKLNEIVEA